ncbi:hypothetical protein HKCCE2091_10570 [Rhodobacterales bacterium HKCCE2091]|nr:hypothetical protein [Rhodobacterales bacterium HKCCE2091]
MKKTLLVAALAAVSVVAGCGDSGLGGSADSAVFRARSFETGRSPADPVTVGGRSYEVFDVTYTYDTGRTEVRRIARVGFTEVECGGADCADAVQRYLDRDEDDDDGGMY